MKKITSIKELKLKANEIRQDIIKMLAEAQSGHTAGALGMADVFTALYFNLLNIDPKKPDWKDRDRLILSNGHICAVQYACMAEAGYFKKNELMTFRKINSRLQGHPHNLSLPGIDSTGGPLGQGWSIAIGKALAAKMNKKKHKIFIITSDGEHQEGQTWEAIMFAGNKKLDNIIAIMDYNNIQISGNVSDINEIQPIEKKYKAFGWEVIEIDGHYFEEIIGAVNSARKSTKPTLIIARTIPGKGVSFIQGKYEWHGIAPTKEQAKKALKELEEERKSIKKGK